jgi:hypothetical protein
MTGRALLFLFNAIETNFLRASSTSEFSHSLGHFQTSGRFRAMSVHPLPATDMQRLHRHVGFVPEPDMRLGNLSVLFRAALR